ncbi:uncharacterized protein BCR38DRAFT_347066 [Pseudomassariella vexata]|uniref:Uncharacterized protein n=1 Tax=Pseudomassariella vexata TaxID=1141098 RepID=A0A1Y2DS77_9PEZI|nr:uncharacterized protein BCR38DRAFT_347066 [Pseudomassariella vexata]ORY62117.1 hypothetical protein BCR38DRAFT_347066 [Pseudomassariella vexata]
MDLLPKTLSLTAHSPLVAVVVLFLAIIFQRTIVQRLPATPSRPRPKRHVVIRIYEIPIDTTREQLQTDLTEIAKKDLALQEAVSTIKRISLVRIDKKWACATASFHTSISDVELARRFNRAAEGQYQYDCRFDGITPLYEDERDAIVDIVAVPGLASHAIGSWKAPSGEDIWLRDYLPTDVSGIRVLLYGYNTNLLENKAKKSIEEMGKTLLESITTFRTNNGAKRPIIFIGHSLGGLLIKEALVHARKGPRYDLSSTCCGMLFFGVPNHGLRDNQLQSLVQGQPNEAFIHSLRLDDDTEPSPFLKRLSSDFAECCKGQYPVISYYELIKSPTVEKQPNGTLAKTGELILMVTRQSATSTGITAAADEDNIAFETDHSGLVKYDSRGIGSYPIVRNRIEKLVSEGSRRVAARFSDNLTFEAKRLWNNLNEPPYSSFRKSSKLGKPEKGTLKWLLQKQTPNCSDDNYNDDGTTLHSKDFISWRDSDKSDCLLITGNPGQGKSVLSNFIVTNLEDNIVSGSKVIYYFCNIKIDEALRNASSILRSLIIQLCEFQQRLFQILPSDLAEDSHRFFTASLDTLLNTFEKMLRGDTYDRVYCVIDGLDVYQEGGMHDLIEGLTKIFNIANKDDTTVLKLLCTSRPNSSILRAWGHMPQKILRCNTDDLELFIRSRVSSLGSNFTDGMKDTITRKLIENAERTFLWIDVVVRKIHRMSFPTPALVEAEIADSSTQLYELYKTLVEGLVHSNNQGPNGQHARILAWIVYAKRPLHYTELTDAIAVDPESTCASYEDCSKYRSSITPDQLHRSLGTLIDIMDDRIYLIHQSVKDFFEEKDPLSEALGAIKPQLLPAYVSMIFLSFDDIPDRLLQKKRLFLNSNSQKEKSFYDYSSNHWFSHISSTKDIDNEPRLRELLVHIVDPTSQKTQLWMKFSANTAFAEAKVENIRIPSQVATEFDIGWLAELLLDGKIKECSNEFIENCFADSTEKGGIVLKVLLQHTLGFDGKEFLLPRNMAKKIAENFDRPLFELLLERRGDEVTITEDVVKAAARNSHNGKYLIALLLKERGDQVTITEDVVKAAAGNWHNGRDVIALLLKERGDQVTITEDVVKAAAGNWHNGRDVIALLLKERGDQVTITEDVVKAAAGNWHNGRDVIALLLKERGDQVTITEDVVKVAAGNWYNGRGVIALLLKERGDQVTITEDVVKVAAGNWYNGRGVIALLLKERGDQVTITEDVVKAAAENEDCGRDVIALLLKERGDQVTITEDVVKAAAGNENGGRDVIALLLKHREEDVVTKFNESLGLTAATCGQLSLLDLICRHGLSTRKDEWYNIARLYNAAKSGDVKTLRQLLVQEVSPNFTNIEGMTPLWVAAAQGHRGIVEVLILRDDADLNSRCISGRAPVFWPSADGREDIVELFVKAGADLSFQDEDGQTAISIAREYGHDGVVRILEQAMGLGS